MLPSPPKTCTCGVHCWGMEQTNTSMGHLPWTEVLCLGQDDASSCNIPVKFLCITDLDALPQDWAVAIYQIESQLWGSWQQYDYGSICFRLQLCDFLVALLYPFWRLGTWLTWCQKMPAVPFAAAGVARSTPITGTCSPLSSMASHSHWPFSTERESDPRSSPPSPKSPSGCYQPFPTLGRFIMRWNPHYNLARLQRPLK